MPSNIYNEHLDRNDANYTPLSPISFLNRSALVFPEKTAVIHGERSYTYATLRDRCRRLASALMRRGIGAGDTVAILSPNIPAMIEAHFGVPMTGAVLNCLNIRLDPAGIAFCLRHGEAKMVIVDSEFAATIASALKDWDDPPPVIVIRDTARVVEQYPEDYDDLVAQGDPARDPPGIADEWSAISLGYTSGTTGDPKGVVCHHRGAYLNALGIALEARLEPSSIYLWTLPMFHCNGWCFIWALTAVGATHVCLRQVEARAIFDKIRAHGVTNLCGAPIVLNTIANAPEAAGVRLPHPVDVVTGGAAPPSAVIAAMEKIGFRVKHLYGLTESYGPALVCAWHDEWTPLPLEDRARLAARQGVNLATLEAVKVADADTGLECASNGQEMGEVLLRGNTIMMGYLKNPKANDRAFADGWFHSGDLAVRHPDGYVEIKDRSKDIIISGGENISSLEVEEILYRHPAVLEAAVVARPDETWGEHPCAFITLKANAEPVTPGTIIAHCRDNMAHYKAPRTVIFGPLPKTATGKIQKYALRDRARSLEPAEGRPGEVT